MSNPKRCGNRLWEVIYFSCSNVNGTLIVHSVVSVGDGYVPILGLAFHTGAVGMGRLVCQMS